MGQLWTAVAGQHGRASGSTREASLQSTGDEDNKIDSYFVCGGVSGDAQAGRRARHRRNNKPCAEPHMLSEHWRPHLHEVHFHRSLRM